MLIVTSIIESFGDSLTVLCMKEKYCVQSEGKNRLDVSLPVHIFCEVQFKRVSLFILCFVLRYSYLEYS